MQSTEMTKELYSMFQMANDKYYQGGLPEPLILIVPAKRRPILGYCSTKPVWGTEGNEDQYEIAVSAEYLRRGPEDVMGTLLHEMVHYHNALEGVEDCTSTQYHKKAFKTVGETHGLVVEKMKNKGYALTSLDEQAKEWFKTLTINADLFQRARAIGSKTGTTKKQNKHKYQCPVCKTIVYSSKEVFISCENCGVSFEEID